MDEEVSPMPSSELWDSVVLRVPGDGTMTAGAGVDVVEVLLDVVVCATAAPDSKNQAAVPARR